MAARDAATSVWMDRESMVKPLSAPLVGGLLRLLDLAVIALTATIIYFWYVFPSFGNRYVVAILIALLLAAVVFQWFGAYHEDYFLSERPNLGRILAAWAVTFGALIAFAFALKISVIYSRVWAVSWFFSAGFFLMAARFFVVRWIDQAAQAGRFALRTVIVGTGPQGQRLAAHLRESGDHRTRILGFAEDRDGDSDESATQANGPQLLGRIDDLIALIRSGRVDQVFIALPWNDEIRIRQLIHRISVTPVTIRLAPDMVGFEFFDRDFTQVARLPMLHLFDRPISGWSYVTKAVEDFLLAAFFLLLASPLLLLIALLIKLDSPGPVFFKQKRYGFNDRLFEVWKFRTMKTARPDDDQLIQATKNDSRVTRIGSVLRRLSLDELPQLFNVLTGDMSIVGPRPHAVATKAADREFEEVVDRYAARHRVKPGITGWAQVNGWRGETDTVEKIEKRVECDLYYIDNWSIWLDIRIIARTILVVFFDKNAY